MFHDHFSKTASQYARFRPTYPRELFSFLASTTPNNALAWDCGTGNGQAAVGLADYFDKVVATDPSEAQLNHAVLCDRVHYECCSEGECGLKDGSVDLVTAAQAFHWFDADVFFKEAKRVLKPAGAIAIWCYGTPAIGGKAGFVFKVFHEEILAPYWPPERQLVDSGYGDIQLPFEEIESPSFGISKSMELQNFLGYVSTWSATQSYIEDTGADPIIVLTERFHKNSLTNEDQVEVSWKIHIRVGHNKHSRKVSR
ncbi:MAG: class I SAM-dependent methyltransferase [Gemmatimonadota bacterium]|nr:class I SAM-dependent methyltransferase [Gemmatimonadota bacterium]